MWQLQDATDAIFEPTNQSRIVESFGVDFVDSGCGGIGLETVEVKSFRLAWIIFHLL